MPETPKIFSKKEIVSRLIRVAKAGWHKSVKHTARGKRNDGALGNTVEILAGIPENNLSIANAGEWELKARRGGTSSLVTLFHLEPSPCKVKWVSKVLLPSYGWQHQEAGKSYPASERSFRQTIRAGEFSSRGFSVRVNKAKQRIEVLFDRSRVSHEHSEWLATLPATPLRLGEPEPTEPYWGLDQIQGKVRAKLNNLILVTGDVRKGAANQEEFLIRSIRLLSGTSVAVIANAFSAGDMFIDFDARTGHNHGTKFRVKGASLEHLYSQNELVYES